MEDNGQNVYGGPHHLMQHDHNASVERVCTAIEATDASTKQTKLSTDIPLIPTSSRALKFETDDNEFGAPGNSSAVLYK